MFGRRRKIIVGDGTIYLFAPSKDSSDDFLTFTTTSASFHHSGVYLAAHGAVKSGDRVSEVA